MSVAWNDIFQLPDTALAGKRIPKTALVRNAHLTRLEQKALDKIALIEHFATVQKSTMRIAPRVDEERDIQSVIFLRCELSGASAAYAEFAGILHPCFPNPTVLLFEGGTEICISCAITRKSLAERGVTVVDSTVMTGGFQTTDSRYAPFLESLALHTLPQDDLYVCLSELSWRIRLARLVPSLGFYPSCAPEKRERLLALCASRDKLTSERNAIEEQRRSKDLTLNDTAKLRIKRHDIEKRLEGTLGEIKEVCHE